MFCNCRPVSQTIWNVSKRAFHPVGIVGLPNVGKSTLFNALTKSELAEMANYPFCTIDPNKADILPEVSIKTFVGSLNSDLSLFPTLNLINWHPYVIRKELSTMRCSSSMLPD